MAVTSRKDNEEISAKSRMGTEIGTLRKLFSILPVSLSPFCLFSSGRTVFRKIVCKNLSFLALVILQLLLPQIKLSLHFFHAAFKALLF